jgi:hypothetical protein
MSETFQDNGCTGITPLLGTSIYNAGASYLVDSFDS